MAVVALEVGNAHDRYAVAIHLSRSPRSTLWLSVEGALKVTINMIEAAGLLHPRRSNAGRRHGRNAI